MVKVTHDNPSLKSSHPEDFKTHYIGLIGYLFHYLYSTLSDHALGFAGLDLNQGVMSLSVPCPQKCRRR